MLAQQEPAPRPTTNPTTAPAGGGNAREKRTDQYMIGIPGFKMDEGQRAVPADEPPPLPINEKLKVIGKPTTRVDGWAKVTGAAKYTADVKLPGMLYAKMITSPHPAAKIKSVDTSDAERFPGVKAVHILDRDLGAAQTEEEKAEKYPRLRYVGQPIGAVAATSQAAADDAARLVKVEYELLPWVTDVEKARQPDAPVVFTGRAEQAGTAGGGGGPRNATQKGNLRIAPPVKRPNDVDIEKAFGDAEVVIEGVYRTQVQTHSALETHGVVSDYKPGGITCYASTQGTGSVRDELSAVFDLPKSKVRVITEFMGGGFGAKFGAGNFGVLATQLSKKAGAPVRLMLDRRQEHQCVGNRPNSFQTLKLGAKKDGTLVAIKYSSFGTGGTGGGAGAGRPTQNMYPCPNLLAEETDVFTNAGPAAAFRAPGHPQGAFSIEQAIDELADKIGIDPIALRDKIDPHEARATERKIGAAKFGWSSRKPAGSDPGPIKRGIGVAQAIWGRSSNTRNTNCEVRVTQDGSVEIMSGVQDIGGGIKTALAQIVAEELGLKVSDISVKIGDTSYPEGPGSGGSVTTNSMAPVARNAAWQVKQQMAQQVAGALDAKPDDLVFADGKVSSKPDPGKSLTFKQACKKLQQEQIAARVNRSNDYATPGYTGRGTDAGGGQLGGVQFVEVAVDTLTGVVKVERVLAVHDCGRPINPLGLVSQINGGVIQGLSYALFEDRILDRQTGIMVNPNLEQYKIAGSREMPQIDVELIEQYVGRSSVDAAGIGEPATVPTAAAVANAVYNAIGVRVKQIPMTPAVVLAALAQKNGVQQAAG